MKNWISTHINSSSGSSSFFSPAPDNCWEIKIWMPPPFSFLSLLKGVWKLSIPIIVSGTEGPSQDSVNARISILCVSWELMKCLASSILFLIDRAFKQAQVIFRWVFLVWLFRFVIDENIISLLNYCCLVVFFYCLSFALWILGVDISLDVLPTCTSRPESGLHRACKCYVTAWSKCIATRSNVQIWF